MKKAIYYLTHPGKALIVLLIKYGTNLPDRIYLKIMFFLKMGRRLNLDNPRLFNDKLQWLKLYNRRPEYTIMVDKYAVKKYVASIIGERYIIPTLGVWDNFNDIEWDRLPNQFVLKTTHGGGGDGVVICSDRQKFDIENAKRKLDRAMRMDLYRDYKEWPYKNVKPRIIAEQYMKDDDNEVLTDYKFACFGGFVHDVMVCVDRGRDDEETKFYFFDRQWNLLRINKRGKAAPQNFTLPKPACMDEMFTIAEKLSKDLPYVRIDLYCVNGMVYFGEITFFQQSGYGRNILPDTEVMYGDLIKLPKRAEA